ncbi:MAG TPA: 6,7-dimethyl-8-ribityllumazine synthase [Candidatus Saccharicenans sp.]|jgi:6,7-dimethyl-8-ribityllumazine synthase|nr:6,7-dimethyl-8-ribityllumazine synthase [Candidatus Saccharicenans sp.]HOT68391.1 6,7-dimethyl-8-ribityllumazine synthase [Candidatus Saccharicenans sp.]HPC88557.1 6,7-dimethyl-8-ribityllumazine synthase [Candidatus Saccharicenans sp.]HQE63801.1 6,7-dimethyl-8-ribityllumazine synthase [Candidatus Saccharicenans sp.]HQI22265.1 6,7-dimethyl-8-ribityllumazine synthase [Candidatus Saccharicenans sp.]
MKVYEGKLQARGYKIAIVLSRFNQFISGHLLDGALEALDKLGVEEDNIEVYKVPGAFEVPLLAKKLAAKKQVDGLICLGALIRGDTPHFDYLSSEVTKGLSQVAIEEGLPISFGILTVETVEQAIERAGTKAGNKGYEAALAIVETINLLKQAKLG